VGGGGGGGEIGIDRRVGIHSAYLCLRGKRRQRHTRHCRDKRAAARKAGHDPRQSPDHALRLPAFPHLSIPQIISIEAETAMNERPPESILRRNESGPFF